MVPIDNIAGRLGNRMFQTAYLYAEAREGKIKDIYIQDYRLFDKYREDIKKLYGEGIGFLPYVSIHVRRGDYVNNPFYVHLWETNYYDEAIKKFPRKNFLVFSDDVKWCKEKFNGDRFQVMEGKDVLEDLNQMASCSSVITANSSLSWWAGYLCSNPGKVVIAPSDEHWFSSPEMKMPCPQEWIRI